MNKKSIMIAAIAFLVLAISAYSQIPGDRSKYYNYGARFFAEVHLMPADSPDSVKAVVLLRMSYSTLNFIKPTESTSLNKKFIAMPYVEAEFKDSKGIIRRLTEWRDTIITDDYNITTLRDVYTYGIMETTLINDNYSAQVKLYDHNQTLAKETKIPDIQRSAFFEENTMAAPMLSTVRYSDSQNKDDLAKYYPYIFENRVPFSDSEPIILIIVSYNDKFASYDYKITLESEDITGLEWKNPTSLSGRIAPHDNTCLAFIEQNDNGLLFEPVSIEPDTTTNYKLGLLDIDLPKENIVPGKYILTLIKSGTKDTLTYIFKVKWMNMPLSLYNYQYAADIMYYILTEEELDRLNDGSDEEVRLKVWNYWMDNDPTPNTLYNEAMEEYFDRVDYAYYNYKTFTQKDGAKTSRGKIYILKGKPEEIIRNINDGIITERWIYPNLKKEFVFSTENNSNYDLKEINEIK